MLKQPLFLLVSFICAGLVLIIFADEEKLTMNLDHFGFKKPNYFGDSDKMIEYQAIIDSIKNLHEKTSRIKIDRLGDSTVKPEKAFDVGLYFTYLKHIKLKENKVLDYVLYIASNGWPQLYVRNKSQPPFKTYYDYEVIKDSYTEKINPLNVENNIILEKNEQSYFEYCVLMILGEQFYLFWHANYNDWQIVCTKEKLYKVLNQNTLLKQKEISVDTLRSKINSISLEPIFIDNGKYVTVWLTLFTNWGGLLRKKFFIKKDFPHEFIDFERDYNNSFSIVMDREVRYVYTSGQIDLIEYDCGIRF